MNDGKSLPDGYSFVPCQLCGSKRSTLYYDDAGSTFRRCEDCGLVFLNPRHSEQYYLAAYRSVDDYAGDFDAPGGASINRSRGFQNGVSLINEMKPCGRLLDIGCGDGRFLQMISRSGDYDLHGLELSRVAARSVSRFLDIEVQPCTLKEAGYPDNYFDIVVMWDVLEHVYNPLREAVEVRRILKRDGLFLARVPNLAYFRIKQAVAGRHLKSRGRGVYHGDRHLTYLDATTARLLLERAGFEVLSIKPARTEYGTSSPKLAAQSVYQAFCLAAHALSGGRLIISIDLLILARPA